MYTPPASILIVGSGVFGLSTAEALSRRPAFAGTSITVVDRGSGTAATGNTDGGDGDGTSDIHLPESAKTDAYYARHFPARDAASIDFSRIIRADYADRDYAALAAEAQEYWRGHRHWEGEEEGADPADHIGADGRYTESGLVLVGDVDARPAAAVAAADTTTETTKKAKTGIEYTRESWANVKALAAGDPDRLSKLRELPDHEAIRAAMGTGGVCGDWGYFNGTSGWAQAEASMAWVLRQVRRRRWRKEGEHKDERVRFVRGRVARLEKAADGLVVGVRLEDGRQLTADLTVVASGAWTERLLSGKDDESSLTGCLTATGQVIGFVPFASAAERARLAAMPVVLNLTTGLFVIPPGPDSTTLKVARHAYGYANPDPATATAVSTPLTHLDVPDLHIPAEGEADLRRGLRQMLGHPDDTDTGTDGPLSERPFSKTRLCWYTDTPTGDFLIDYHPQWRGLFVATGGSGHGFKFLPVLGDRIVDAIMGQPPAAFAQKWAWKKPPPRAPGTPAWQAVVTADGSRGGRPGVILSDELAKPAHAG